MSDQENNNTFVVTTIEPEEMFVDGVRVVACRRRHPIGAWWADNWLPLLLLAVWFVTALVVLLVLWMLP